MAYNPNEPRVKNGSNAGEWTSGDATSSIQKAASDIKSAPLSEKEFYKKYVAQHKDLRSQNQSEIDSTKKSIMENGFREGRNANAIPIYKGDTGTIISQRFGNKKGDIVYLLPKEAVINGANGYKTKEGFKPTSNEIIIIEKDGQKSYDAYKNQFK